MAPPKLLIVTISILGKVNWQCLHTKLPCSTHRGIMKVKRRNIHITIRKGPPANIAFTTPSLLLYSSITSSNSSFSYIFNISEGSALLTPLGRPGGLDRPSSNHDSAVFDRDRPRVDNIIKRCSSAKTSLLNAKRPAGTFVLWTVSRSSPRSSDGFMQWNT